MDLSDAREEQSFNALHDPEERRVLHAVLDSFRQYRKAAHYNITHLRRQAFYSLPSAHIDILSEESFALPRTLRAVDEAIDSNADIAEAILNTSLEFCGVDPGDDSWKGSATPNDLDKARSTIKQLYRDWSGEGLAERHASHSPIFTALSNHLPPVKVSQRHVYRILIPGAGLGRLVLELCAAGYNVEGNEISYHQLLASNYILNETSKAGQHTLYPWALSFSNHLTRANQLQSVLVPDERPVTILEASAGESEVHHSERMSMTAGDFCQLYKQAEYAASFDAVATCFFIDTAPNVISYVETVKHCLKPDGIWINLGPLLWHFESAPTPAENEKQRLASSSKQHSESRAEFQGQVAVSKPSMPTKEGIGEPGSFELSNDEVVTLIKRFGFEWLEQKQAPAGATGYIQDPASMLQNVYRPAFWVAKKRQ